VSRKAALPLDKAAVRKSDDHFYANHPELVQDGERIPLDATDPKQARLRSEWMDLYEANHGRAETTPSRKKKPADAVEPCPICKEGEGQLVITVVDQDFKPVAGAEVAADALSKQTDGNGVADFGVVPAKTYSISARKDGYFVWGEPGSPAQMFEDTVTVISQEKAEARLGLQSCVLRRLKSGKPLLIAKASQSLIPPIQTLPISGSVGGPLTLEFGQDTTHGVGGSPVTGHSLGVDEKGLRAKMSKLLDVFAGADTDGKAKREFDAFLSQQNPNSNPDTRPPSSIKIHTDPKLDKAVEVATNFATYPERALAAPGTPFANPPKTRIHQALEAAGWDVNSVTTITDLGVPVFNVGDKFPFKATGDWANGLAVMINAVQYVLVFVDLYEWDHCKQQYTIRLTFELYDVFGLDDEDLKKFGATGSVLDSIPHEGITAWWELQHEWDYAPLITKATVTKTFTVSTK
jgi:hypothetical protein